MFIDSDSPIGFNRLSESWIVPLAFAIFPVRAMALEQVMYRCGALGDVSIDRSRANPSKAVVVYGDQRWPGTISAGSMTFFSSTSQAPESPWMNFGRNGVGFIPITSELPAGVSIGLRIPPPIDAIILAFLNQAV